MRTLTLARTENARLVIAAFLGAVAVYAAAGVATISSAAMDADVTIAASATEATTTP